VFSSFIVWYLFLAGVSGGAFLVAVATMFSHRRKTRSARPIAPARAANTAALFGLERRQSRPPSASFIRSAGALTVSALCILAASFSLAADFSDPFATWRVILAPLASITSFGAVTVMMFTLLAVLTALIVLIQLRLPRWLFVVILAVGSLTALGTILYAGFLLSIIVTVDLWRTWLIPLLFSLSSLACGLAATLFIEAIWLGVTTPGFTFRWHTLLVLGLMELAALVAFLLERASFSPAAFQSVELLLIGDKAASFWLGIVAIGCVMPLMLHLLYARFPLEALILVSTGCTLIGGFFIRFCIVNAGVPSPIFPIFPMT
jgi:formate-dependent nitrite reductase membrane component NrfD